MYQSFDPTPSGSRSSTPAPTAASAVVIRSTPSAPNPRRRSHNAATRAAVSVSSAPTSGSNTKSFCVPWPLAKITRSGYLPPRVHRAVDNAGAVGLGLRARVEPVHPVVPAKPRALPPHITASAHVCLLARFAQLVGCSSFGAGVQRREHLGV